jgi:hypothetical protein
MARIQKRKGIVFLAAVFVLAVLTTAVRTRADELSEVKQQLDEHKKKTAELEDRVTQLEARQKLKEPADGGEKMEQVAQKAQQPEKKDAAVLPDSLKWAEKVKISGDIRYRHEHIDEEKSGGTAWKPGRDRERIRARLMVEAKANNEVDLGLRLASGVGEPVSTNQTLENGFSQKGFWLDLAYFDWHPAALGGSNFYGGKVKNPFYVVGKNQLIWDGDLSPEGLAAAYKLQFGNGTAVHFAGGGFWVDENSAAADPFLWGGQAYLKHEFEDKSCVLGGLSYFDYTHIKNGLTAYDDTKAFGNTATTIAGKTYYVNDYDILEAFAEYIFRFGQWPMSVFGNYVQNTTASTSEDTGWLVGFTVNKAKEPGSWEFAYDYRDLEKDAVLGVFTDSDFIGGGTGGDGHRFAFTYQLAKNFQAAMTYFHDQKYASPAADYRRLQADLLFKF